MIRLLYKKKSQNYKIKNSYIRLDGKQSDDKYEYYINVSENIAGQFNISPYLKSNKLNGYHELHLFQDMNHNQIYKKDII